MRPARHSTTRSSWSPVSSISATPSRWPATRRRPRIGRCRPNTSARPACCRRPSVCQSASSISATLSRISIRRWRRPVPVRRGSPPRSEDATAVTLLFDRHRTITSPALVPDDREQDGRQGDQTELVIGLVNNMPGSALKATERQFARLLHKAAAPHMRVRLHCFSLPSIARTPALQKHVAQHYDDIGTLGQLAIHGLIVTGAEPIADDLRDEPYWPELTSLIDWAATHTRSAIWSCLAAHAAVLHLDGVARRRLPAKCSGVYDCSKAADDWLTRGVRSPLKVSHSRYNALDEHELTAHGYQMLTRSD